MKRRILIVGASRGLGAALAEGVPTPGDVVWLVSRGQPQDLEKEDGITRHWVPLDLRDTAAPDHLAAALQGDQLDIIIYNAGIWESTAFSAAYEFDQIPPQENNDIFKVNLIAPVNILQRLLPHIRQAENGKIILIGSTSGLGNTRSPEVAYNASKFGLRGVAQGLREILRPHHIGVTVINPGSINTTTPLSAGVGAAGAFAEDLIPLGDLITMVNAVLSLSKYSCVKEINIPAMRDPHV